MFESLNNKANTIKEGIELEKLPFTPLKDYIGKTVKVDGYFFTTGKYGKQVVVVGNGAKINMPARAVEAFEAIGKDETMLKALLEGHLELTDIKEVTTKNGTTTAYTFKDC